ncbi:UDP-N-acetylglucosamine kinase [Variovorax sp. GrIS 2.14]|uniref:zeta toxin family protein n=1 Tax=Variovorax sp. GrIS 2.14 TaxID=3071709 RepID=UPI0038F71BD4
MASQTPSPADAAVAAQATDWARDNRKRFAADFTLPTRYPGEQHPVALFMAGSPGAGKTEASKALLSELGDFLRIDPDEFRKAVPGYDGTNSWLIQSAVSYLVEAVLDRAFRQKQSFLLDGTLSSYTVAERNIQRCIDKDRDVQIIYVYQDPKLAWDFVQAREVEEGRRIPADRFVEQFFASRDVVNRLKAKFAKDIMIDVILKNTDGSSGKYHANVADLNAVAPLRHSREEVTQLVTSQ